MRKYLFTLICAAVAATTYTWAQETERFLYTVGEFEVYLLSEGQGTGNASILLGASEEMIDRYVPYPNAVNVFLVKTPDGNYLFDTGFGRKLFDHLAELEIRPGGISRIYLTHMHGDHIGGLFRNGEIAFPKTALVVPREEERYWTSDPDMNRVSEGSRKSFDQAREVLTAYGNRVEAIASPALPLEIPGDGIYAVRAFGHTPGHTGYLLVSQGETLFIWGDLTHAMAVQMPHPEIAVTYDVDPEAAVKSREAVLEWVAEERIPIAGMHVPYPGIGLVEKNGEGGYRFIPAGKGE